MASGGGGEPFVPSACPLTEAVAGPADFGARRAGCGCLSFEVLYISIYVNSILMLKKCNWLHLRPILLVASPQLWKWKVNFLNGGKGLIVRILPVVGYLVSAGGRFF